MRKKQSTSSISLALAVGGTGGHLFPAQQLAEQLHALGYQPYFLGHRLSQTSFFYKKYPFYDIKSSQVYKKNPLKSIYGWTLGTAKALYLLRKIKPKLVIGFGSYHAFPVLVAAKLLHIPFVLFESNYFPGQVNKVLSPLAKKTYVCFEETKRHLKGQLQTVRLQQLQKKSQPSLSSTHATVLVFGGSQGSAFFNAQLPKYLSNSAAAIQVIHITGREDLVRAVQKLYTHLPAQVMAFVKEMRPLWELCDFVICRSGAMTLNEHIYFKKPALFVPYPKAKNRHQWHNALFAQEVIKGSEMLEEPLDKKTFLDAFFKVMENKWTMEKNICQYREKTVSKLLLEEILAYV